MQPEAGADSHQQRSLRAFPVSSAAAAAIAIERAAPCACRAAARGRAGAGSPVPPGMRGTLSASHRAVPPRSPSLPPARGQRRGLWRVSGAAAPGSFRGPERQQRGDRLRPAPRTAALGRGPRAGSVRRHAAAPPGGAHGRGQPGRGRSRSGLRAPGALAAGRSRGPGGPGDAGGAGRGHCAPQGAVARSGVPPRRRGHGGGQRARDRRGVAAGRSGARVRAEVAAGLGPTRGGGAVPGAGSGGGSVRRSGAGGEGGIRGVQRLPGSTDPPPPSPLAVPAGGRSTWWICAATPSHSPAPLCGAPWPGPPWGTTTTARTPRSMVSAGPAAPAALSNSLGRAKGCAGEETLMGHVRLWFRPLSHPCSARVLYAELQQLAARILGMEDALFVPTATMANLIAGECPVLSAALPAGV